MDTNELEAEYLMRYGGRIQTHLRAADGSKVCPVCEVKKPLEAYYRVHNRRRGTAVPVSVCKVCQNAANRAYRTSDKGKAAARRIYANDTPEDRQKRYARAAVGRALRSGRLTKGPCEQRRVSPCSGPVEAHHPDYTKPLAVAWICRGHHFGDHGARVGRKRRPAQRSEVQ